MTEQTESIEQVTLPAGTIVKVNGFPFRLSVDTAVDGATAVNSTNHGELPFDPGYVHAYLKAALLTVEPEGCTEPQAAYFLGWLEQQRG